MATCLLSSRLIRSYPQTIKLLVSASSSVWRPTTAVPRFSPMSNGLRRLGSLKRDSTGSARSHITNVTRHGSRRSYPPARSLEAVSSPLSTIPPPHPSALGLPIMCLTNARTTYSTHSSVYPCCRSAMEIMNMYQKTTSRHFMLLVIDL